MIMTEYKIYPKQFRNEKIPIEKNRCFFIMPFLDKFDIVFGEIKAALSKEGYICVRVDDIPGSIPIISKILNEILKSQFIIADLTDCNPNVFYELGIAHTFKDAENIFLLKQHNSKVPFDITHLTYIEYDSNNLRYLTAKLKESLSKNKYLSNFYDVLNIHGIIDYIHDNQDEFIEKLKQLLNDKLSVITDIIDGTCELEESEIQDIIFNFKGKLQRNIDKYDSIDQKGILEFYSELLLACDNYSFIQDFISSYFSEFFLVTKIRETSVLSYKTDLAIKFAKSGKQLDIVMPWIISYFRRSKSGTVDLNRYKLESFLLTTYNRKVNEMITHAMVDNDAHIREHMADLIGEKRLLDAHPILCNQLLVERNYYTASSIIEALGKIGKKESIQYIKKWLSIHETELVTTKHLFIFKHIRIAIAQLDLQYLHEFEKKYSEYLEDYIF